MAKLPMVQLQHNMIIEKALLSVQYIIHTMPLVSECMAENAIHILKMSINDAVQILQT